jgi:molybdopterin converting factor subunit 1
MKVQVLFFGATAEAVGKRQIEFEFPEKITARDAFARVVANFPQLRKHQLLFAVNQEYADSTKTIENGDELAIFTPVSGG